MLRKIVSKLAGHQAGMGKAPEYVSDLVSALDLKREARTLNEATIRSLCHSAYLGDNTALCRVLGRYKMYVDSQDFGLSPHLMLDGYWEMWVTEALVSLVRPGMVVADIGANLGYYALLLADLVGDAGMVHAFEPNPRMACLLNRSISMNGFSSRIALHQVALGSENSGEVALLVPPGDPKNGHIVPIDAGLPLDAARVPLARLDGRADWANIEFAKIDVEGAEQIVWAGAQGLLDNGMLKTVLLEFTPDRYADPAEFVRALTKPGFSLSCVDPVDGIVDITLEQILQMPPHQDIILVLRR